jgi:ribose transport system substrate-binding protein
MKRVPMKRIFLLALLVAVSALVAAGCGGNEEAVATEEATAATTAEEAAPTEEEAATTEESAPADETFGESFDADPALLEKALGTSENVPDVVLAAVARADDPVDIDLAIKCWKEKTCDTGTGGELTVALADGFGENVWREVTHMEFVLQALTYPEIGKIIYTSGQADTQKAISDLRSLIAQGVDVIVGFPDAAEAMLPTVKEATAQGVTYVPYIASPSGTPGEDYLTFVAEDLCVLGENFAGVLNEQVGEGKVVFLGGTPGNALSTAWQNCEEPALNPGLELIGKADTNWTREGTLEAMSGFLSSDPDLKGISYEYADGFLGGVRAYEAAGLPLDVVLTLRTDEFGLFCEWNEIGNPNFKIFYSSGGGFDSRIALTAGMMALKGAEIDPNIVVPAAMRQVDDTSCNPDVPGEAPASTLVSDEVLAAMYPS